MKILDRYISRTIISGTLMVLLVLGALLAFVDFVSEMDDVGKGQYSMLQAAMFVLLSLPNRLYEIFPTAVLIGSLLSLGTLAGNSEFTVMRAAGISIMRIVFSVLKAGFILLVFVALIGELVVPASERQAQNLRAKNLQQTVSLAGGGGFWARDGQRFMYVSHVFPGMNLGKVNIYELSENNQLTRVTHAKSAQYLNGHWQLNGIQQTEFNGDYIESRKIESEVWQKLLNPDLFNVVSVEPGNMSAIDLFKYSNYLRSNELDSSPYELAFWIKVFTPVSSLVMLLIALPFIFGSQRSSGAGNRLLVGLLLGISFYLLNRTVNHLGQVYHVYPFISASAPVIAVAIASFYALRRVK
ncbi:MAG: LPS export ABC transporter permease LptG [Gammaproteobacteria bacterium]|nr:LPS export ABC transporter permease LptG [Gammaproteobacteria bacterium]